MKSPSLKRRLRAWGRRQLYSLLSSLGTLLGHRLGTVMTVLVLGIAMVLPLGLYVAMHNARALDLQVDEWGSITVFLNAGVSAEQVEAFSQQITARGEVQVVAISPQQGMQEFRDASGFGAALDVLDSNPLPWVLQVRSEEASGEQLAPVVEALSGWLEAQELVDSVLVDHKWLQRLAGLLRLGSALVTILTVMFSLAVVVVIANTIRLDVANRAAEIEILSLVGAGDSFIRQPFLYSGFWYGLMGAVLALVFLHLSLAYLSLPLQQLLDAYGNAFALRGLDWTQLGAVLLCGGFLGFLGAWISVQRYLRALRRHGSLQQL